LVIGFCGKLTALTGLSGWKAQVAFIRGVAGAAYGGNSPFRLPGTAFGALYIVHNGRNPPHDFEFSTAKFTAVFVYRHKRPQ